MHTILVLGGYGFFGARICAALAEYPGARLLVAGRDIGKARVVAESLRLDPRQAFAIDAAHDALPDRLRQLGVDTLIHTAGPFQHQAYHVARAAIQAGCNYIDLADGRAFVAGISKLDADARERNVALISGASSVPALSSAVVDRYLDRFERLDSIRMGIGSGAKAPGLAAVEGVFDYCGQPIRHWEDGRWQNGRGWLDLHRHVFPAPVGARLLGRCDVPDLELFPRRYPSVATVSFHAGIASSVGHLAVWTLAGLVRVGLLRSVRPFAAPLHRLSRWLEPLFSDSGGMFVTLEGIGRDGVATSVTWNVIARQNHGPHIPCGAAIALARKLAGGAVFPAGAMPCVGLLTVEEYLEPLRYLDIHEVAP